MVSLNRKRRWRCLGRHKRAVDHDCDEEGGSDVGDAVPDVQDGQIEDAVDVTMTLSCLQREAELTEKIIQVAALNPTT